MRLKYVGAQDKVRVPTVAGSVYFTRGGVAQDVPDDVAKGLLRWNPDDYQVEHEVEKEGDE